MHDILEGVCVYVMRAVLKKFIFEKKYFTLKNLNEMIQNFNYLLSKNKPTIIIYNTIKNQFHLKMSASEILLLIRYFPLIVGHLIPRNDTHWQLFLYLRQICDIVSSPRLVESHLKLLEELIKLHNNLYIEIVSTLKPKFHFLVHYPRILKNNVPCVHYWGMRFESRHKELKNIVQSTSSLKNLLVTIAKKEMLKFCYLINNDENSNDKIDKSIERDQVEFCEILYKVGMYIIIDLLKDNKQFGKIKKIKKKDNKIYFNVDVYEGIDFDEHYNSYICGSKIVKNFWIEHSYLPINEPCLCVEKDAERYICTNYIL